MKEPEFPGIEPARVPEVKRRLQAIRAYLAMPARNGAETIRLAQSVGLSRYQFNRLVRIWQEHRDPAMLVITKRGSSSRDYGIDPQAKKIAEQIIARMDCRSNSLSVSRAIIQRCDALGVKPPSQPTVYNWIKQYRANHMVKHGSPTIAIGRVWPRLVVNQHNGSFPLLLVAIALPEKAILAHRISFDPDKRASISGLVYDLLQQQQRGTQPRSLLIGPQDLKIAQEGLRSAGLSGIKSYSQSVQRLMSRSFGHCLADLPIVFQVNMALKSAAANLSRQDEPIDEAFATATIESAIALHNQRFGEHALSFDLLDSTTD